jgi:hypothetical protein
MTSISLVIEGFLRNLFGIRPKPSLLGIAMHSISNNSIYTRRYFMNKAIMASINPNPHQRD